MLAISKSCEERNSAEVGNQHHKRRSLSNDGRITCQCGKICLFARHPHIQVKFLSQRRPLQFRNGIGAQKFPARIIGEQPDPQQQGGSIYDEYDREAGSEFHCFESPLRAEREMLAASIELRSP